MQCTSGGVFLSTVEFEMKVKLDTQLARSLVNILHGPSSRIVNPGIDV